MEKFLNFSKNFLKHELISGSMFLFTGGLIGSFLSFLYNLFLARTLTQADYGVYTSLLSLEALIIVPAASLAAVIVRFASHYLAKGEEKKAAHFYKRVSIIWLIAGILIFFGIYAAHPFLLKYLHLKDPLLILLVGLGVAVSYVGIVNAGFLQSLMKFKYLSMTAIVASLIKLIVGVGLVLIETRTIGALTGILILPLV